MPAGSEDPGSFEALCADVLIPKGVLIPIEVHPGKPIFLSSSGNENYYTNASY